MIFYDVLCACTVYIGGELYVTYVSCSGGLSFAEPRIAPFVRSFAAATGDLARLWA